MSKVAEGLYRSIKRSRMTLRCRENRFMMMHYHEIEHMLEMTRKIESYVEDLDAEEC